MKLVHFRSLSVGWCVKRFRPNPIVISLRRRNSPMNRKLVNLLTLVALILSLAPVTSVLAAPPVQAGGKVYTIQKDDWLSKLSDKEYGDVLAYPAIVYFNNLKASEDRTFTFIDNPDVLEVGWVLYIPSAEEATGFLSVMSGGLPGVDPLAVTGNIVTA